MSENAQIPHKQMEFTEFDSILKDYTKMMLLAEEYNNLLHGNDFHNLDQEHALDLCGSDLGFVLDDDGKPRLHSANFCRKRICPMCQWRKSQKQFSNCLKLSDLLEQQGYRFLHLVLTVPNCAEKDLKRTVSELYKSFSKFWKYKEIQRAFKGCLRCFELTYNYDTFTFHPHLHCLIAVKKSYFNDSKVYLSYPKIQELWSKANKSDISLQCSVGAIKNNLGFAEVSKYCLKPLELDSSKQAENITVLTALLYTLKGTRFIQSYGVIKDCLRELKEDTEPQQQFDIEQMFVYHYNRTTKTYDRVKI